MSTISATSAYSAYSGYTYSSSTSGKTSTTTSGTSTTSTLSSATNVTLSASARAALAAKSFAEIIAETRVSLTELLEKADSDSPYKDGELAVNLSGFDRRELYAIAGNTDGTFTADEIKAAAEELSLRFDQAMAGANAVYNVTGNIEKLYTEALTFLEAASPEEQKTEAWATKHTAVKKALASLEASPDTWPDVDNDPVIDYLARVKAGTAGTERDFASVANDARAALDAQIAEAEAAGKELVFSKYRKSGIQADFSDFSSRSLSAIVLNEGEQFSESEIRAAKDEMSSRARQVLLSCISSANSSSSPTSLAENIISAYGSLSSEERAAVGWGEDFYSAALTNYKSASYIASMFETDATSETSFWSF
ncbi:MAG: hypothetical protein KKH72_14885 [Alphaproteobacteria bacterium]|nr:hypothetical protein [Alphaproteobacteria bacterium]